MNEINFELAKELLETSKTQLDKAFDEAHRIQEIVKIR
jgi:hypothetical protein